MRFILRYWKLGLNITIFTKLLFSNILFDLGLARLKPPWKRQKEFIGEENEEFTKIVNVAMYITTYAHPKI